MYNYTIASLCKDEDHTTHIALEFIPESIKLSPMPIFQAAIIKSVYYFHLTLHSITFFIWVKSSTLFKLLVLKIFLSLY